MTINDVVKYINENLMDELRLANIAKLAGYSSGHLSELFKKHTGKSIMFYIRDRRMEAALSEMRKGRRILDIACDYGFETQAGFYKAFNTIIGCAPSEYKSHELRGKYRKNIYSTEHAYIGDDFMKNVVIRPVKQNDAKELWENIFSRNTPAEVEERIAGNLERMKNGEYIHYVAEVEGAVIGNMLFIRDAHPLGRHKCTIGDVVVNPAFQRRGIAKRLLEKCKEHARKLGLKLITVNVRGGTIAEEVYKKLGFVEAGRIPEGIIETWGSNDAFDEVVLYQKV